MKELWRRAYMLARVSYPKMQGRPEDFRRFAAALGIPAMTALKAARAVQERRVTDMLSYRIQSRRHWKYKGPVTVAGFHAEHNRKRIFGGVHG